MCLVGYLIDNVQPTTNISRNVQRWKGLDGVEVSCFILLSDILNPSKPTSLSWQTEHFQDWGRFLKVRLWIADRWCSTNVVFPDSHYNVVSSTHLSFSETMAWNIRLQPSLDVEVLLWIETAWREESNEGDEVSISPTQWYTVVPIPWIGDTLTGVTWDAACGHR